MNQDKREAFNLGDGWLIIKIATLILFVGVAYGKITLAEAQGQANGKALERIEHYLSSRDPEYWQRTKEQ